MRPNKSVYYTKLNSSLTRNSDIDLDDIVPNTIEINKNEFSTSNFKRELLDFKDNLELSKYKINHRIEKITRDSCSSYVIIVYDNENSVPFKILDLEENHIDFDFNNTKRMKPYFPKYVENINEDIYDDFEEFAGNEARENDFMFMLTKEFKSENNIDELNYIGSIIIDIDEEGKEQIRELFFNYIPNPELLDTVIKKIPVEDDFIDNDTYMDSDGSLYKEEVKGRKYKSNEDRINDINENLTYAVSIISNLIFNETYPNYIFEQETIEELERIVELIKLHEVTGDKLLPIQSENLVLSEIIKLQDTVNKINLEGFLIKSKNTIGN